MKRKNTLRLSEVISYLEEMIQADCADNVEVTLYEQYQWENVLCPKALKHVKKNMSVWM